MASEEDRLISALVARGDLTPVLDRGIDATWMAAFESQQVMGLLLDHYRKYGQCPSPSAVKASYPNFRLVKVSDTTEYLVDRVVDARRARKTYEMVRDAVDLLDKDDAHNDALDLLRARLTDLDVDVPTIRDIDLSVNSLGRLDYYDKLKASTDGMLGLPTGFDTIDKATAGLQPGQLVTIVASPKVGKSQLALAVADHIHKEGMSPLFLSFEMSNLEQQLRFDALRAGISHNRLRRGLLHADEEAKYRKSLAAMEGSIPFVLADSSTGTTVSALGAKIGQIQPDVVFVDGAYLMLDEITGESNTAQSLTNITRGLKRLAQRTDLPIVVTTQALLWKMKGTSLKQDSIGYTSSYLQDSDVVLGLEKDDNDELIRYLRIIASRNCGTESVTCLWDWDTSRFEEMSSATTAMGDGDTSDDFIEYGDEMLA